ncbi:telomere-protecting terminal protein Tpg [Streptomyces sp. NPDC059957]|uniref:telomere-protecting terminal protein Tpg n=1 Tax=unclassified Streptomyces TaxID=2593676 RepID=UPI0036667F93
MERRRRRFRRACHCASSTRARTCRHSPGRPSSPRSRLLRTPTSGRGLLRPGCGRAHHCGTRTLPASGVGGPRGGPRRQAAQRTGLVIETRARFGFTAAPGTTDDGRMRRITQHVPPEYEGRLCTAQEAGAVEAGLQQIAAEALHEAYGGRPAAYVDGPRAPRPRP